jgi:hypothetical protein
MEFVSVRLETMFVPHTKHTCVSQRPVTGLTLLFMISVLKRVLFIMLMLTAMMARVFTSITRSSH